MNLKTTEARAKSHQQRGNAIVEFAIITPFLIGIMLGIVEVGRYAYFGIIVSNAARAGASYGAQRLETAADSAGMETAATNDYGTGFASLSFPSAPSDSCKCWSGTAFTGACTSTFTCASGTATYYVTVTVQSSIKGLFKLPFVPKSITVTRSATMRVQNTNQ